MVISIDKFIFKTTHNIQNLTKAIKINIDKKDTITKPTYTQLGGYETSVSFSANILLNDKSEFKEFEAVVKKGRPLKISALDLISDEFILIEHLELRADNFFKARIDEIDYYSLSLNISGYILENGN